MTTTNSLVPSPEQVDQWFDDAVRLNSTPKYYIARQAAQWGADQELEACCKWIPEYCPWDADQLRAARRPKPPTLKEQALEALEEMNEPLGVVTVSRVSIIRRALEALDD
jgi:hypothetical protein